MCIIKTQALHMHNNGPTWKHYIMPYIVSEFIA